MKRAPTEAELLVLRRMLARAGGRNALLGWIDRAGGGARRGRPKGSDRYGELDRQLLGRVQSALDFQEFDSELPDPVTSITAAVRSVVDRGFIAGEWGASPEAVVRRLLKRLEQDPGEIGFHRRERRAAEL